MARATVAILARPSGLIAMDPTPATSPSPTAHPKNLMLLDPIGTALLLKFGRLLMCKA